MKFFIVAFFIFFLANYSFAQNEAEKKHKLDSLKSGLKADSLHTFRFKKLRPYGNIDNRNSFVRPSNFSGYQLGVIVNEYHTFGIGFYQLNNVTQTKASLKEGYQLQNLSYNTVFYEYLLFNKRYYEVDLPFEIGYGEYKAKNSDTLSTEYDQNFVRPFLPVSAGVKFIAKPVRWIGLSVMVGFRYFLEKNFILDFDGFYFPVGIWVDLRQVYRDIKYFGFQKKDTNAK